MYKNMSTLFLAFFLLTTLRYMQAEHVLSFAMPCYNCATTMRESIDSIYQQNLTIPFEVVCTDDCSTDDTLSILREYEKKYSNFKVFCHATNLGGGAANNTCVAHARGDLLFRLDSDNILVPNCIMKMIELLDSEKFDGVAFQSWRFFVRNAQGEKVDTAYPTLDKNVYQASNSFDGKPNPGWSGNYLYTRDSFDRAGGYPVERSGNDTHCFGHKQYLTGSRIAILPGSYYWHHYNINGYWGREERSGQNRKITWLTLKQFRNHFTPETQLYLDHVDVLNVDPYTAMAQGKIVIKG